MPAAPVPFLTFPDGSEPRVERLEWLTDVKIARDGSERRAALRAFPRLTIGGRFLLLSTDAESTLSPLRTGQRLLVPAWMHAATAQTPGAALVASVGCPRGEAVPFLVRKADGTREVRTLTIPVEPALGAVGWNPTTDAEAWPLVDCYLADDSFDAEYRTPTVRAAQLRFTALLHRETPAAWDGAKSGGLFVFPQRLDWTTAPSEGIAHSLGRFDAGHLWSQELRHTKRSVQVGLKLIGRAAIADFRRWCYAVQGRALPFRWTAPMDAAESTWRLADDAVELSYLTDRIATSTLRLVQVSQ